MKKIIQFLTILIVIANTNIFAHGGRTDSNGGHTNRKTGEYHCHAQSCFNARNTTESENKTTTTKQDNSTNISLKISDSASQTPYNRKHWKHWIDKHLDCQDERAEVLIEQSLTPVKFATNKKCRVVSGKWIGLYTKNTYTKASDLDIDHVVPLKEAHLSGGDSWSKVKKMIFANDRDNLIAVDKRQNRQKGFKDPSKWLPLNTDGHCRYIRKWTFLKLKYNLTLDNKEIEVVRNLFKKCNSTHQSN